MGIQNKPSLARKRLSTLAVTTTLAAVGVGVIGTGAANAATSSGVSQAAGTDTTASKTVTDLAVTAGTGADSLTATADISKTVIDPSAVAKNVTVTIDWGDGKSDPITVNADLSLAKTSVPHTYTEAKKYTVTLQVEDGIADAKSLLKTQDVTVQAPPVTVQAPKLMADVSTKTPAAGSPVVVKLAGSTVDPSAVATAKTTIKWGDTTADSVIDGDPATIAADNAKLSHSYAAAGTYTLSVQLDDGLGNPDSKTTAQTFTVTVSATGAVKVVVNRAAGTDRYATGLVISQHEWADKGGVVTPLTPGATPVDAKGRLQAKSVVLATGTAFPDALAGVPLAKKVVGPLLLTNGANATTNPDVLAEIQRILPTKDATGKATTIYVLGGEKAISAGVQKQLEDLGYAVHRLAGNDRYGTALAIAKDGMGDPSHIILARGDEGTNHNGFADALSAGPYAANVFGGGNSAVVLSNFTSLDADTKAYVTSKLKVGQKNVAAIGGQAVTAIKTIPGADGLYAPAAGFDRYETAKMVANAFLPAGGTDKVGIATGMQFPDALTGGAYMATVGGPLLLTDPKSLPAFTSDALGKVATTTPEIDIFGGTVAITDDVAKSIAAIVKVTTIGKF